MKSFIVIGAPRSGTSLVAGVLNTNDIDMGSSGAAHMALNPHGYVEDGRFSTINDELIHRANGNVVSPPLVWTVKQLLTVERHRYLDRLLEAIEVRNSGRGARQPSRGSITVAGRPVRSAHHSCTWEVCGNQ